MNNEEKDNDKNMDLYPQDILGINTINEENLNLEKITDEDIDEINQFINNYNNKEKKENTNLQKEYDLLIDIFKKLNNKELFILLKYLEHNNIPIWETLINGFIDSEIYSENQENKIIEIIAKTINILFNKKIFYFVYEKLSYAYRKHRTIINMNYIKKFEKIFLIWKLLYNIELYNFQNNNMLIYKTDKDKDNKNIIINIGKDIKKAVLGDTDIYEILIKFESSSLMKLNKYIDGFSFLKVYNENGDKFKIAHDSILSQNQKIDISKLDEIKFTLVGNSISIIINNDIKNKIKKEVNFDFKSISKLELLNNFYGVISSIIITKGFVRFPDPDGENKEYDIIKQDLYIEIKDYQLNFNLKFLINNKEQNCNIFKDIITYEGEIFRVDYK